MTASPTEGRERPVRLRLSRKKGFDLQAHSRAVNGLPAVNVSRPGPWGNPFIVTEKMRPGVGVGSRFFGYVAVPTAQDAVDCYAEMMAVESEAGDRSYELRKRLPELRGHNLACWCSLDAACHADVLLRLANGPVCEPVSVPPSGGKAPEPRKELSGQNVSLSEKQGQSANTEATKPEPVSLHPGDLGLGGGR